MVIVLEMTIITGRVTVIWRKSVLWMVTILRMVDFLRSLLVLRMVIALVMVTTAGYSLFPLYGHMEGHTGLFKTLTRHGDHDQDKGRTCSAWEKYSVMIF